MEAHGPFASWSNWMPTALLLARPENLYELTFLRLLGSDVRTTLPDLHERTKSEKKKSQKRASINHVCGGVARTPLNKQAADRVVRRRRAVACSLTRCGHKRPPLKGRLTTCATT